MPVLFNNIVTVFIQIAAIIFACGVAAFCSRDPQPKPPGSMRCCAHRFQNATASILDFPAARIEDGEVFRMVCPVPGCGAAATEDEVQQITGHETFEKYMRFKQMQQDPTFGWSCMHP